MAVPLAPVQPRPAASRRRAARLPAVRAAHLAVGSLVVLPILAYAVPAALGHPVVPGDDLTQNLPLRELVGRDLAHGQLPVYDPYIWSGAPLLAGWNAGAAYPLTWLFAVLPGALAWAVTLVATAAVAGTSCYWFLRTCGLGVLGGWVGGLTFAFGGAMVAQVPHVGLVAGMSWVPLALLAVLHLTDPARSGAPGARLRWTAVLAAAVGLVVLAGEPRAVADAAVVLAAYALWRLARLGRRPAGRGALAVGAGLVLGVGLGAVQLLPGLAAVASSQRAAVTATLFSSGSLPPRWLALLGVPDLLGGSGAFGQPTFLASYNLTEVAAYVGMVPLVAAGSLLARLRPADVRGWRRGERPVPDWLVWHVVGAVGILLALGNNTPLWHVLIHIPLFGGQRLQSRSLLVVDLALAVLAAYWTDGLVGSPGRAQARRSGREAVGGSVAPLAVVGLVAAALAGGPAVLRWLGATPSGAGQARALGPWLVPFAVLALGALALVWGGGRLGSRRLAGAVGTFVVVDLATFVVLTVLAVGAPTVGGGPAVARGAGGAHGGTVALTAATAPSGALRPISAVAGAGRFVVYDPGLLYPQQLSVLGVPDANVLDGTFAVQGYSSLADGRYAAATGAHRLSGTGQNVLAPAAWDDGVLDELDTTVALVPAGYLVEGGGAPAAGRAPHGARTLRSGTPTTWYLGTPVAIAAVTVARAPGATGATGAVQLGLDLPTGRTVWLPTAQGHAATGAARWAARAPGRGLRAVAVVARTVAPGTAGTPGTADGAGRGGATTVGPPVVEVAGGGTVTADGALVDALAAPHWAYGGTDGGFAVYRDRRARPPLRLEPLPGGSLGAAVVRARAGPAVAPTAAIVDSPHGAVVVRAVAAIPGWSATWRPIDGGPVRPLAVQRAGIVQAVRVPAGRGVVTWTYRGPEVALGGALSLGAAVLAALVGAAALAAGRGARRRPRGTAGTGVG